MYLNVVVQAVKTSGNNQQNGIDTKANGIISNIFSPRKIFVDPLFCRHSQTAFQCLQSGLSLQQMLQPSVQKKRGGEVFSFSFSRNFGSWNRWLELFVRLANCHFSLWTHVSPQYDTTSWKTSPCEDRQSIHDNGFATSKLYLTSYKKIGPTEIQRRTFVK